MLVERTFEGRWWTPGHEDDAVTGTLSFTRNAFVLRANAPLLEPEDPGPGTHGVNFEWRTLGVIWGSARDSDDDKDKSITLFDADALVPTVPGLSALTQSLRPAVALIGDMLDDDVLFDVVVVRTEHLEEWAQVPPIRDVPPMLDEDRRATAVEARIERTILDSADVDGFCKVELRSEPVGHRNALEFNVRLQAVFRVSPVAPCTWRDAYDTAVVFAELVRLGVCSPCALAEVHLRVAETDLEEGVPRTSVELLRRTAGLGRPSKKVHVWEMCFTRSSAPGGLQGTLTWWLDKRGRYRRAWQNLTGRDYVTTHDAAEDLAAYFRALTSLAGADNLGASEAAREGAARRERALDAVNFEAMDAEDAEWLQTLIDRSKDPYARQQVIAVVRGTGVSDALVGDDVERFTGRALQTRNDVEHPSEEPHRDVLTDPEDAWHFGAALQWAGFAYLLRQLGIPTDNVSAVLLRRARHHRDHVVEVLRRSR